MLNKCQRGGDEDKVEYKKRLFENSTGTGIQQDCQRCFRACQGRSHTSHGKHHFSLLHDLQAFLERADDIDRRIVSLLGIYRMSYLICIEIKPDLAHELSCVNVVPTPLTAHFVPCTTQRTIPNAPLFTPFSLPQRPSGCSSPVSALDATTVLPPRALTSVSAFSRIQQDFFTSAYSDYGTVTSPLHASNENSSASSSQPASPYSYVSPTLLYGPSSITSTSSPLSPPGTLGQSQRSYHPLSTQVSSSASSHLSKSFCCPKPNRNKSYTHMNALKYYHMARSHCNSTTDDLEAAQAHFTKNGVVVNGNGHSRVPPITEGERREVERKRECRRYPFSCGVDDYQWRCRSRESPRTSLSGPRSHPHLC